MTLWPPNPNEFDSAGLGATDRGSPCTTSSWMSSPSRSRLAVGGTEPFRIASRHATASVAPAAPIRWPVTPLVDVTGGGDSPNTLRIASASAASFNGCRRAVRVHVPDLRRGEAGVFECELHARGRALTAGQTAR